MISRESQPSGCIFEHHRKYWLAAIIEKQLLNLESLLCGDFELILPASNDIHY
jgi:hypothetical protein